MLRVNEIFRSCQGEGVRAGVPTTFIRLQGCNLSPGCSYCDTRYAQSAEGRTVSLDDILSCVETDSVCITGGEPLHQDIEELVARLYKSGISIEIFTNGSLPPPAWYRKVSSWVVDIKCPSSGVKGVSRVSDWVSILRSCDQLKFTVADSSDLSFVIATLNAHSSKAAVIVSPVIQVGAGVDDKWARVVWDFCCRNNVRFSLQVHKIVFGDRKGV